MLKRLSGISPLLCSARQCRAAVDNKSSFERYLIRARAGAPLLSSLSNYQLQRVTDIRSTVLSKVIDLISGKTDHFCQGCNAFG